ncbi:MAG TPA: hypothetical protein VN948_05270 [Terriglobales bacterium]|nr:hypothetical protein [Terriglobales bacterium]
MTAEKVDSVTSAAEAFTYSRAFTAALKALRHPKPEFFGSLLPLPLSVGSTATCSAVSCQFIQDLSNIHQILTNAR